MDAATEPLLATLQLCATEVQRRPLERRVVLLTLELADNAARRYRGRGVDLDDLTQVARLGLVKAIRGYRSDHGPGFAAYAVPTVTGEIKRYFRDHGWAVRPPRRLQEISAQVPGAEAALRQRLQREPSDVEVAAAVGVSPEVLEHARRATGAYHTLSLEGTRADDDTPIQVQDADDAIEGFETRTALATALASLTRREREILRLRFVEERTQAEIGQAIGVSQMQVSRLLAAIMLRLRSALSDEEAVA